MKYNIKRKLQIGASACMLLLTTACAKNFLTEEYPGELPEDYTSEQGVSRALIGGYQMATSEGVYDNGNGRGPQADWGSRLVMKMLASDEGQAGGSGIGDQSGYQDIDKMEKLGPENTNLERAWNIAYVAVDRLNAVINNVDTTSSELSKRAVAEAKALRAFTYFDLVTLWGEVPLITSPVPKDKYKTIVNSTKAALYEFIIADLKDAISVLPLKSAYSSGDRFRMSKGSAQALLGKVYLYQASPGYGGDIAKYAQAAELFDAVISSGVYDLEPSVQRALSQAGEFGIESVFENSYINKQDRDNAHIQLMGPRTPYFVKAPSDDLVEGYGFNPPSKKMWDAFMAAGDEVRRKTAIMSLDEHLKNLGQWTTGESQHDFEGYFRRTYGTFLSESDGNRHYGTNFRYIRFSDVLLMAAEAHNRSGKDELAKSYLNRVRKRSGLVAKTTTSDVLFEDIVKERQLELAFEGHRFTDLIRWGIADIEIGSRFVKGKHEVWPIPASEVRSSSVKQNPGY